MDTHAPKAVFLSYASQDSDAARRVAEALRGSGIEVWFDQSELRGGEAWDQRIRKQIKECALFLPVVSAHTQARREGYFRLEWKLAEERTHLMAKGTPFVVPVCIDTTSERTALVPDGFLSVQWTRLPDGEPPPAFCEQVKRLLTGGGYRDDTSWAAGAPPRIADYELLRLIGRGSYGDVWLARGVTGIYFAIKVVWRERFGDAAPFEREFRGLKEFAAISHGGSSQLALLHVGRNDEAGFFYYVMELSDDAERGREIDPARYVPLTLTEMCRRRGRLPADESVTIAVALAKELAEIHDRGLVHRDIKPSNVIMVGGLAKLADIGLVSRTGEARTFVGTEGFVPPEGPGSPAADVYALGKLLYEISTGLDRQQFPQLPPELNRLPDYRALLKLNEVILRACDPRPEQRYPDGRAMLMGLSALQAGQRVGRLGRGGRLAPLAAMFVVGVATLWWWQRSSAIRTTATATQIKTPMVLPEPPLPALEKSLVVMPLKNLSLGPANEFPCEGLHAEIVATLKRCIPDWKVIGRSTPLDDQAGEPRFAEIGLQLGVGNALSGSVQREGSQVRIVLELQWCSDGVLRWTQKYDREVHDILTLQSEIADEVARVLQAQTANNSEEAARFLTKNPRAYEHYLAGIGAGEGEIDASRKKEALEASIPILEESLKLDPNFMPAADALSNKHTTLYTNFEKDLAKRTEHAAEALRWAERASQMYPGGGGIIALTFYYTNVEIDNVRAEVLARTTLRAQPNHDEACNLLAMALGGQGRSTEGQSWGKRAIALNPRNMIFRQNQFMALAGLRRRDEWKAALADYRGIASNAQLRHWSVLLSRFRLFGELPTRSEAKELALSWRVRFLWMDRRFAEAQDFCKSELAKSEIGILDRFELLRRQCDALHRLGSHKEAEQAADALLALTREMRGIKEFDHSENDKRLAHALSLLGRHDEAIVAARRYVEKMRIPQQQMRRWLRETELAEIYAAADRPQECIDLIARLLRVPSWLTLPMLKVDPVWDNVRDDPRFQALLKDPKNDAPF